MGGGIITGVHAVQDDVKDKVDAKHDEVDVAKDDEVQGGREQVKDDEVQSIQCHVRGDKDHDASQAVQGNGHDGGDEQDDYVQAVRGDEEQAVQGDSHDGKDEQAKNEENC